jgi:hypothetical protein
VEHLLKVTQAQRSRQIERLAAKNDPRTESPDTLLFSSEDMQEVMSTWRKQPEIWMNAVSLKNWNALTTPQAIHNFCKSRFSTMLFELFGNKSLVDTLIRVPICSAQPPATVLKAFAKAWDDFKDGQEIRRARENSERQVGPRLSKQIYLLQKRIDRGRWIANWLAEDWYNWWDNRQSLDAADQNLLDEYYNGNMSLQKAELKAKQQPTFRGAGESMAVLTYMPGVSL